MIDPESVGVLNDDPSAAEDLFAGYGIPLGYDYSDYSENDSMGHAGGLKSYPRNWFTRTTRLAATRHKDLPFNSTASEDAFCDFFRLGRVSANLEKGPVFAEWCQQTRRSKTATPEGAGVRWRLEFVAEVVARTRTGLYPPNAHGTGLARLNDDDKLFLYGLAQDLNAGALAFVNEHEGEPFMGVVDALTRLVPPDANDLGASASMAVISLEGECRVHLDVYLGGAAFELHADDDIRTLLERTAPFAAVDDAPTIRQPPWNQEIATAGASNFEVANLLLSLESTGCPMLPKNEHPKELTVKLYDYQRSTVKWMKDRELGDGINALFWQRRRFADGSEFFVNMAAGGELRKTRLPKNTGGFLCEEMGLGKTVEMLALILINQAPVARFQLMEGEKNAHEMIVARASRKIVDNPTLGKPVVSCATLIITPLSLLGQWANECRVRAPSLRVYIYHGDDDTLRPVSHRHIAYEYDVVLTTYDVLREDLSQKRTRMGKATLQPRRKLHSIRWWRVVLDESQRLANPTAAIVDTCTKLHREHSWLMSGTPAGRVVEDLQGQCVFLRIEPWDRTGPGFTDFWRREITLPWQRHDRAALECVWSLLSTVMIRHSKDNLLGDLQLPSRTEEVVRLDFAHPSERFVYTHQELAIMRRVRALEESGELRRNFMITVALKDRLERLASHTANLDLENLENEAKSGKSHLSSAKAGGSGSGDMCVGVFGSPMTAEELLAEASGNTTSTPAPAAPVNADDEDSDDDDVVIIADLDADAVREAKRAKAGVVDLSDYATAMHTTNAAAEQEKGKAAVSTLAAASSSAASAKPRQQSLKLHESAKDVLNSIARGDGAPKDCMCPVCQETVRMPVILRGCGHFVCTECLVRHVEVAGGRRGSQKILALCPLCRYIIRDDTATPILSSVVGDERTRLDALKGKRDAAEVPLEDTLNSISDPPDGELAGLATNWRMVNGEWRMVANGGEAVYPELAREHGFLSVDDASANDDQCAICNLEGVLVCCEKCPKSYHFECLSAPREEVEAADPWHCPACCAVKSEHRRRNMFAAEQYPNIFQCIPRGERFVRHYDVAAFGADRLPSAILASPAACRFGTKPDAVAHRFKAIKAADPLAKLVIFSRFRQTLYATAAALRNAIPEVAAFEERSGFPLLVTGEVSAATRAACFDAFRDDADACVLCLSTQANNAGLTLVSANHLFLVDLCRDVKEELQLVNRIHRIGQLRPVKVTRFVLNGTIEERAEAQRSNASVVESVALAGAGATSDPGDDMKMMAADRKGKRKQEDSFLSDGDLHERATEERFSTLKRLIGLIDCM